MQKIILPAVLFLGCFSQVVEPEDIVEPEDLTDIAEAYCASHPEYPCGHVYLCEALADNPLGHVEICVNDDYPLSDVEALYGHCEPTPRHAGLCWTPCPPTGPGCNAYDGCYCPAPPMVDAGVDSAPGWRPDFPSDKVKEWL